MKVFDLHCDTLSELRYAEEAGQPKSFAENDLQIDLKKLQKGDYMLQCFAAFVNLARPGQDPLVAAAGGDRHLQADHGKVQRFLSRRCTSRRISARMRRRARSAEC